MTHKHCLVMVAMVALLIVAVFASKGLSQGSYPDRPITVVIGFGAGGLQDLCARALSKAAEKELGQPMVVENKVGAAGVIAMAFVAKSKPDGYTLGHTGTSQYIQVPNIRKTPYDPFTDIVDILKYVDLPFALAVRSDAPWNTFEELIAYVRKNPGKFTYSTAGVGLAPHICMERIALKEGLKWTHIPFKSGAEAVTATLGGHTQGVPQMIPDVSPHIRTGKLKMLLVLSEKRSPEFPNVPTILEKGYDFHAFSSFNFFGPKGLPEPIRQKLETGLRNATKAPSFIEAAKQFGIEVNLLSGPEYTATWKSQYDEMGNALRALGLAEK